MGLITGLKNWFSGKTPTEYDYPSLPGVSYKGRPVNMAMAQGFDDEENAWLFDKVTGGKVPIERDRDGRPYIKVDGSSGLQSSGNPLAPGSYYLDRPGLDTQTWRVIGSNVALLAATGGVGEAAKGVQGLKALAKVPMGRAIFKNPLARGAAYGGVWEGGRQGAVSGMTESNAMDPGEVANQAAWMAAFGMLGPAFSGVKRMVGLRPLVRER